MTASHVNAQGNPDTAQMWGLNGWETFPIFTVGETIGSYTPPGILDGLAAYDWSAGKVRVLANHELGADLGYPYILASGALLTGARVSYFDVSKDDGTIQQAGPAYDTIYNRAGVVVQDASDLGANGLHRLCSSAGYVAGQAGFVDDIYFTGEETGGGTEYVLDVIAGELWACPAMGRAAWENVTALEIPSINKTHVAILVGDDRQAAALLLYIGEKSKDANASFIERNGLARGRLFMWVANDGSTVPSEFLGTGNFKQGQFVEVDNYNPQMAGTAGFDELGYATQAYLDQQKLDIGAFLFSRPEDLHTNPNNGSQVVFASTGRSGFDNGADSWGTTYLISAQISPGLMKKDKVGAGIRVIFDGDDADKQDFGIRSPDNLVWSSDNLTYIQEDRSIGGFGQTSGEEASIWQLHPHSGVATRVAQMNRGADLPDTQSDPEPTDIGNWESSGIIDVSGLFGEKKGTLYLFDVQAHNVVNGSIASENLVQGGQLLFLVKP